METQRLVFVDVDGVLNCQLFYERRYKGEYPINLEVCPDRMSWLNQLIENIEAKVVISSSWRSDPDCVKKLREYGATFDIIGLTPHLGQDCVRGNEIYKWISDNEETVRCCVSDYKNYVIIDDDSDMLYQQRNNLFLTDFYSGLTPNTCYKIKRFFNKR